MTLAPINSIPLASSEALWEWHIPSDILFLSEGTLNLFCFSKNNAPTTMTDFLAHIPPPCLPKLHEMRESVLNGTIGSFVENAYPFKDMLVQERMIVTVRDATGRGIKAMGHYQTSPLQSSSLPPQTHATLNSIRTGYWQCSLVERTLHMDAHCAVLLGYAPGITLTMNLDAWKARLHPEEGPQNSCRYQLLFEEPLMGDAIEDRLKIRLENGTYANLLLRGSVVCRNAAGKALNVSGSLQSDETASTSATPLFRENGRLLFALNATGDGLWDWDAQTDKVYFSPRYLSMLGYTSEQFGADLDSWKKKIHQDDYDKIVFPQKQIVESSQYGDTFECVYRLMRSDGNWAWILGRGYVTHRDAADRATRLVGLHTDVTAMQTGRQQLEDQVKNDPLTGLRSRNYCDMDIKRIERHRIRPVSVISCDVDGLKLINDYMGHATGDILLQKTSLILRHFLRATDCIARTGGDEFVILLPSCPLEKAQHILSAIEKHFKEYNDNTSRMPIFVSLGVASSNSMDTPLVQTVRTADRHMLRNKMYTRTASRQRIKVWIEQNIKQTVSLEDSRYEELSKK